MTEYLIENKWLDKFRETVKKTIPGVGSWTNLLLSLVLLLNFIISVQKFPTNYELNFILGGFTIMTLDFYIIIRKMEAGNK